MNTIKRLSFSLLIFLIIYFIGCRLTDINIVNHLSRPLTWLLFIIFLALGELLGFVLLKIARNKKRKTLLYCIGHSISMLLLLVFPLYSEYNIQQHKKNFDNIESNARIMEYFVEDNEEYVRTAFKKLESTFDNPNNIDLDAFSVKKRDTVLSSVLLNVSDTVYTIWFTYFLNNNTRDPLFSKVNVFRNIADIELLNIKMRDNAEYMQRRNERNASTKELIKSLKELEDTIVEMMDKKGIPKSKQPFQ